MTRVTLATANAPGAVAILQLHGEGVNGVLHQLTGKANWTERRAMLVSFAGIDEGLAVLINAEAAQLMPHGGPRVVQKLIEHLTDPLGCEYDAEPDTQSLYPEAGSPIEADMLDAIARAASPAAIDLLAAQPKLWRGLLQQAGPIPEHQRQSILDRSRTLDRLIHPPTVVVVGPPNAGKSTLTNALMGRAVSIVADLPGTTRDWVGGLVELSTGDTSDAIAVHWLDTPGLQASDDAIEQRAIALAREQIERSDVLIAMRAVDQDWPDPNTLRRVPDLWVVNKVDDAVESYSALGGRSIHVPLHISAANAKGINELQSLVLDRLSLNNLSDGGLWAFSKTLEHWCDGKDEVVIERYLAC